MALFVIADLHLSLACDKPMDVFKGWDNYTERIEKNWRRLVSEDDTVVVPGDISWAMSLEEAKADFAFIDSLPGKKIIMKGNHDYWWSSMKKMECFLEDNGFKSISILHNNCYAYEKSGICGTRGWINEKGEQADKKVLMREAQRLSVSIEASLSQGLEPMVFLHYPPIYIADRNEEILAVLDKYNISHCFFGHIHGKGGCYAVNGMHEGRYYKLIASDFLQFTPLNITEFVQYDNSVNQD